MDISAQLEAFRKGALVRPLHELDTLVVTGPDRQRWLSGMVTSDVASLKPGQGGYALSVGKTGRIQSELWLCLEDDRILLGVPRERTQPLLEAMQRYLIMEDAEIAAADRRRHWWLAHGPESEAVAKRGREIGAFAAMGRLGEHDTALVIAGDEHLTRLADALLSAPGAVLATPAGWERVRIEHLLPRFGVDFEVDCYPQEAALERLAVSFNKGCYLGQEAVFMLEKRGHVSRRLVRLELDGPPPAPQSEVHDPAGARAGHVTSSVATAAGSFALAMVKYKQSESGTVLAVGGRPATVSCVA